MKKKDNTDLFLDIALVTTGVMFVVVLVASVFLIYTLVHDRVVEDNYKEIKTLSCYK